MVAPATIDIYIDIPIYIDVPSVDVRIPVASTRSSGLR
jgi:hypothetical protein